MTKLYSLPTRLFDKLILSHPKLVIICLLTVISFFGYYAKDFRLDASAETLILENDKDLRFARLIYSRYGQQEYLFLAYTPKDDLFSDETLGRIAKLRNELTQLEGVSSVVSLLDVPLLESPPVPIKELASNIRTLESTTVDRKLAIIEFRNSPIYRNLLISSDLKTTALQIILPIDDAYRSLLARRNFFREKQADGGLTSAEATENKKVTQLLRKHRDKMRKDRHQLIAAIRVIMANYRQDAELILGGISMVSDDLISFIKSDLKIFGLGVLFFLIITLAVIFKKVRWVILPMFCCSFSAITMFGLLGKFGWEVTVISSNFISLQLILTMAITVHLIVRYRELQINNPEIEQKILIRDTIRLKFKPCLYAGLTTIAGFGSLVLSDILPVIAFGWMMIAGIIVSLVMTFLLFPASLMLLPKGKPPIRPAAYFSLTSITARFTEAHGVLILIISCLTVIISIIGISILEVENSFINYFKENTEIYRGMKIIDRHLGGTTPLDVVIDLEGPPTPSSIPAPGTDPESDNEFSEFDEFDEEKDKAKYWFTAEKIAQIVEIHDYLASLAETGKVLSLASMIKIAEKFNQGKPLDNFQLALLYSQIPDEFKNMVLKPYVSVEHNQVRFFIRVRDTEETLKRNKLLKKIRHDMINNFGLKDEHVYLTGLLVLYNNMLQSLYYSQILTLGITLLALMGMFLILFRSLKVAVIAIFPNLLSIVMVLGVMGWLKIPLDMMTITIAAISVGIAVDDTIHYIHRFKHEFNVDHRYLKTMYRCHGSIGYAMYYTSLTIIIGFSILVLSNFMPSIYFGLLTGLAMFIALIAALTLLPALIIFIKPFGPEA